VRLTVKSPLRFLRGRISRLLEAAGMGHGDVAVLLRTVEGEAEYAAAVKLARDLEKHALSWVDLEMLAEVFVRDLAPPFLERVATSPDLAPASLKELVAALSSKEGEPRYHIVPDIYGRNFQLLRDVREDASFKEAADRVIGLGRSLLYYDRLYTLYESMRNVSRLHRAACLNVVEVGVYRGGTSFFLCDLLRTLHASRARFYSIDTFEGHSATDLPAGMEGHHSPKMFANTSREKVSQLLSEFPFATVIKGRIQECTDRIVPGPFHFVHLDTDLYEPTLFSLNLFLPRMVPGGIVCVDDYNKKSCPGVRQAVDQVLDDAERSIIRLYTQTAQCVLVKAASVDG
jgi:hypothetical protein